MAQDPAFLFYYKDILVSCADWDPDALGWYLRLFCHQADKPEGLPDDLESLASLASVKFSQFARFKACWEDLIQHKFVKNESGLLVNLKMKKELDKRRNYLDAQSVKGVVGAFIKRVRGMHDFKEREWKTASRYLIENFDPISFNERGQVYLEAVLNSYAASLALSLANNQATSPADNLATSNKGNANVIGNGIEVEVVEGYGKYENHFHGDVPDDLMTYAMALPESRRGMNDAEWQTVVQADLIQLGYKVSREVDVPELKGKLQKKERCIDLVASRGFTVVAIELDNVTVNPVCLAKIRTYPIGMVLLRNPKPSLTIKANVPVKKLVTSSTSDKPDLDDAKYWTDQAISGNDHLLTSELKNRGIVPGEHLKKFALDHLDLAGRYSWPERWTGQQSFRQSLIKHISDELAKIKPQKKIANHISLKGLND